MHSENYKIYRENITEIQNLIFDVIDGAPFNPDVFDTATQEEKEQYNKELNEYLEFKKPEIIDRFKEMGFKFENHE